MRDGGRIRVARWGGALLVALAPLPWLGLGTAVAGTGDVLATVDGHQAFSAEANNPAYWGADCTNVEGGAFDSYLLTNDSAKVIVKAGSEQFANTLFNDAAAGETVWADTNGDTLFNPGGQDGDKQISHIIVCAPTVISPPTEVVTTESTEPAEVQTTRSTSVSPTEVQTTRSTSVSPTEVQTTRSTSVSPTETETSESPSPTETESSASASPSETQTSQSPTPVETGSHQPGHSPSASVEATRLTQPAVLPHTGSGVPVGSALVASMLFIGLGTLLLLGPGRLISDRYSRKH